MLIVQEVLTTLVSIVSNIDFILVAHCEGTSKTVALAKKAYQAMKNLPLTLPKHVDPLPARLEHTNAPDSVIQGFKDRSIALIGTNFDQSNVINFIDYVLLDPIRLRMSVQNSSELTALYKAVHKQAIAFQRTCAHLDFWPKSKNIHESISLFRSQAA